MVSTCYINSSNFEIFPYNFISIYKISLCILKYIAKDQLQTGDAKRETNNIADKMHELEFVFMLNFLE